MTDIIKQMVLDVICNCTAGWGQPGGPETIEDKHRQLVNAVEDVFADKFNWQHTSAPWKITNMADENRLLIETDGYVICQIDDPIGGPDDENARLIAAAPDMLAALVQLKNLLMHPSNDVDESMKELVDMCAAIAKAKGETA